jgi:hypothetical protein
MIPAIPAHTSFGSQSDSFMPSILPTFAFPQPAARQAESSTRMDSAAGRRRIVPCAPATGRFELHCSESIISSLLVLFVDWFSL